MGKDKLGIASLIRHRQKRNENNHDTPSGPINAHLIDQIQPLGEEDIHQGTGPNHSPEHENGLPGIGDKVLIPEGNGAEDQLTPGEGDTECDGPIANEGEPAIDEGHGGGPFPRGEHGTPVVDSAGGGVDGADLGQRGGNGDGDEGDDDPAPDDADGLAVGEGDVEGGAEAEGGGHDGEGTVGYSDFMSMAIATGYNVLENGNIQAQNTHHTQIARQFTLVTHSSQRLIGVGIHGRLSHVGQSINQSRSCVFLYNREKE